MKVSAGSARRYARAALDVATAKGDGRFQEELESLARAFAQNAELRTVLVHPAIPAEKKTAVVAALLGGAKEDGLLRRLVSLLLQRDRIELLPLIAQQYARLANAARGVVEAEAVSARELDESEARAITTAAAAAVGKKVELRRRVDPALAGGLLLRMEGRVYDGSVRARLHALREHLAGTPGR